MLLVAPSSTIFFSSLHACSSSAVSHESNGTSSSCTSGFRKNDHPDIDNDNDHSFSDAESDMIAAAPVVLKCIRMRRGVHFRLDDAGNVQKTIHTIPRQEFDADIYYSGKDKKMMHHCAMRQAFELRQNIVVENCIHHLYRADDAARPSCDNECSSSCVDNDNDMDVSHAAAQDAVALATLSAQDTRGLEELVCNSIPANRFYMRRAVLCLQDKLHSLGRHCTQERDNLLRAQSLHFSRQSRDFAFKIAQGDRFIAEEIAKESTKEQQQLQQQQQVVAGDEALLEVDLQGCNDLSHFDYV